MANELKYALSLADAGFTGPAKRATDANRGLKNEVEGVGSAANRGGGGLSSFISKAGSLAVVAGATTAAVGLLAGGFTLLKSSISQAMDMESTKTAFTTLIGDMEQTEQTLERLQTLGASTPFQFATDIAPAARSLLAFGVAADSVPSALSRIGDVASGVGAPLGEISELFGKAKVQGTLFSEDINQMTGRGIPIIQEFAKILGVSQSEVKKLASEGKISFPMLDQAFRNLTKEGGKFHGMMQQQSQTSAGMISTLKDNVDALLIKIGTPINDKIIKPMLQEAMVLTERIGTGVIAIMDIAKGAIANGSLGELVSTSLRIGFGTALNYGVGAFQTLGQVLGGAFEFGIARLNTMFDPATWAQIGELVSGVLTVGFEGMPLLIEGISLKIQSGFGGAFQNVISHFQAGLEFAIQKVMEGLTKIPGLSELLDLEGFTADSYESILEGAKSRNNAEDLSAKADEKLKEGMSKISDGLNNAGSGLKGLLSGYVDDISDYMGGVKFTPADMVDVGAFKSKLEELASSADPAAYAALMGAIEGVTKEVETIDNEADQAAEGLDKALADSKGKSEDAKSKKSSSKKDGAAEESKTKIRLYGLEESALRRLNRMSEADKDKAGKSGLDYLRKKPITNIADSDLLARKGPSPLDYLRKNPITDIKDSTLNLAKGAFTGLDGGLLKNAMKSKDFEAPALAKTRQDAGRQRQADRARWDSVVRIENLLSNLEVA